MIVSSETFVEHVASHAGISSDRAATVVQQVLTGLGAYLPPPARQLLAEELPASLAPAIRDGGIALPLEERVLAPGMSAGHARELIASVCRVLAEQLSPRALDAVREGVPARVADLLVSPADEQPRLPHEPRRAPTLANGRPGSSRPLSEARPARGHSESVAAPNPHGSTKLSSTTGTTQERLHESLAEGHIDPDKPVSGTRR